MNVKLLLNNGVKTLKANLPEILTGLGIVGVFSTSYLTGKAAIQASEILREEDLSEDRKERTKEVIKYTWKIYIPPVVSGAVTVGCILGASKTSGQRTAAAVAAYSLSEKAFSEYREKVVEQVGVKKEQKIRDDIAQDHITKKPLGSQEVLVIGNGQVLCCELLTNRYFRSDMETLRKAQNDINEKIIKEMYVTLSEFYELIGLPYTSVSSNLGWDSDSLVRLDFSTVMGTNGEPCLAFEYSYTKPLK
jgi:hypothetical protein